MLWFSVWLKLDTSWAVVLVSREGEKIESWASVPTLTPEVHITLSCWLTSWISPIGHSRLEGKTE